MFVHILRLLLVPKFNNLILHFFIVKLYCYLIYLKDIYNCMYQFVSGMPHIHLQLQYITICVGYASQTFTTVAIYPFVSDMPHIHLQLQVSICVSYASQTFTTTVYIDLCQLCLTDIYNYSI